MKKLILYLMTSILASFNSNAVVKERLDALFEDRYADSVNGYAPGGSILIARGDSIIYERYFGVADMQNNIAIDSTTLFNIASVSKQFTVVALLQNSEKVDINSVASQYFDYPQEFWGRITLADLAGHTSGLPDKRDRGDRNVCVYADEQVSKQYFPYVDKLLFEPGTDYYYLNPSFILLADIVEQATGEEFYRYVKKNVYGRAGMLNTCYFSPSSMPSTTSHGYVADENGGWKEYDYGEETFFATRPDGGIYSNVRDMLRWERALANGVVLDPALRDLAYTPRVDVSKSVWCDYQRRQNTWYGLGWFIDTTPGYPKKVYHTGDNGGYQAYVAKYPEKEVSIIVLENRNDRDRWSMAKAIDSILYEEGLLSD